MKKRLKQRNFKAPWQAEPDMAQLIVKMQQQLISMERKIDALASRSLERPLEARQQPKPFQRFDQPRGHGNEGQGRDRRERALFKAICADCNKECEVPFRPSQDRPVYCKECFSKRKAGGLFKTEVDNKPRQQVVAYAGLHEKQQAVRNTRPIKRNKSSAKRRKKRG
jgi:CxxC-x17-CxxC domain-containing protein